MPHLFSKKLVQQVPTLLFALFLITAVLLNIANTTHTPSQAASIATADECAPSDSTLYLIDGASSGSDGTLSFAAGSGAASDTIPAAGGSHIAYILTNVNGTYTSGSTDFDLFIDSGSAVGNGIQAEIRYDFDGNGTDDRIESYGYFPTNDLPGWETYTESSFASASSSFTNLVGGAIEIRLWNAIGAATGEVRTSATDGDGEQSLLDIPFSNLTVGGCDTPTPTTTPTASNTPTITPTPSPTVYQTATPSPTPSPTATPATILCTGVSDTAVALPGVGCYTTSLPDGETSVTFWPAVDNAGYSPAIPKITDDYTGPLQTNDWWSSLIWDWNQGDQPYSQNMHPHPFSMQAEASGMRMSYAREIQNGTDTAETGGVTGYANYLLPDSGAEHLKVTVNGMNAPSTDVVSHSDWAVTAYWEDGADTLTANFGPGIPYVFFEKTGGDFVINLIATPFDVYNSGEVFAFTASNNVGASYALFGPAGSTWVQNGLNITLNAPAGKHYLAVAALPDNTEATRELFRQHAYNFVTDTTAEYSVNGTTQEVTTAFTFTTEAKESSRTLSSLPLIALFRHQWLNLGETLTDTGLTYDTARGEMRLYEADSFTTEMTFGGVLPALPDLSIEGVDGYTDAELQSYVSEAYDASGNYGYTEEGYDATYWEGKNLNRLAQLAHIADQQGMHTERDSFLNYMKRTIEDWFDGQDPYVFYLDTNWDVLQGYPSGFGADSQINDHNFHWGYFIMAASAIAQYDTAWAENYEGMVELLVKDAANWDRTDTRFPHLRHFDMYSGHSWAAGHQAFGAGNNQESSSESMNFSAAVILWASAVGNDEMRDAGIYLYTTEQQAVEQYWFDVDEEVFPPEYPFETVGILWSYGTAYATWWTANPEEIHGINFLPLTGGALYLGHRPDYVLRNIEALYDAPGAEGHWHDLIWQYEAFADPQSALARWDSEPNYVADGAQEKGESTAHTYHWLHTFNAAGQVDPTTTADTPTYAVFKDPDSGALTCVAYNATGTPQTITFSNGAVLTVQPRTLASTSIGGCVALDEHQYLPLILR